MGTHAGVFNVFRALSKTATFRNALRWRELLSVGMVEAMVCVLAGTAMGALQLILWGIGARYLARTRATQ